MITYPSWIRALLLVVVSLPAALHAADLHVATTGNDTTGNGSFATPYRTIQRAANLAVAGDNVIIRAGTYRETVRPANSGTAGARITYKSYESGGVLDDVVISGADPVTGWTAHDTANGRAIYKSNAMTWNLSDTGASFGTAYRNQLFLNGQMQVLARWPNVPAERITCLTYNDLALVSAASGQAGSTSTSAWIENTSVNAAFPAGYWNATRLATARVFLSPATMIWGMSVKIASQSSNRLNLDAAGTGFNFTGAYYYPTTNNRFYIYDYYDALDTAGEYWKDVATNTVYLWAHAGADPATLSVEAKRRDFGLSLGARSHLTFQGIKLFACTVDSDASSNALIFSEIEARYLAHIDNYAVTFSTAANSREFYLRGDGHIVQDSYFNGAATTAIGASGTNIRVENNVIRDFGYAHHGPAILARNGAIYGNRTLATKNQFLRNTAFNGGHTIVTTDPALDVKYNRIYNSHLRGSDVGAIGIASTDGLGSEIAYNVISDANGPKDSGVLYGGFGIYFDYECRNYTVHHNIVWGTTGASYQIMPNRAAYLSGVTDMGMKFYHNTGTSDFGLIEPQEVTGVDVRNNLVRKFLNGGGGTYANNLPNVQFANNTAYTTDAAAPFRDRANNDLRFATGTSTGVNAGAVISPYSDGFVGAAPDTGALEFDVAPFIAGATLTQRQLASITATSIAQSGALVDLQLGNLPEGRGPPSGFQARIGSGAFGGTLAYDHPSGTWRLLGVAKGALTGTQTVSVRLNSTSTAVALATPINAADQTLTTYRAIPMDCGGWFSGFAIHSSGRLYGFGDVFGMWRSNDAGQSWKYLQGDFVTNDNDTFVNGAAVSPNSADTVAFLTPSKIFKSTDGGATWANLLTGLAPRRDRGATPLIFHPGNANELWLASARTGQNGTLWRSPDGGATWLKAGGTTFDSVVATTIYVRPELPNQIWVGAVGGLYVSADYGSTFTRVWSNAGGIAPLDGSAPTVISIARRADGVGYIATNTKGWQITASDYANPATYNAVATVAWWNGWGPSNATVLADGSFLTNTSGDNLSRSIDGGLNWAPLAMRLLTPPTPPWTVPADASTKASGVREMIVQDPTNPARWFMTGGKAPFITTDSGATWKYPPTLSGLAGVPTYKVRFPRGNPSTALIPSSDMGGFTVTDAGFSGHVANSIHASLPQLQTYHDILSSDDGQVLVAAGTDQGNNANLITRSIDGGVSWTVLDLTTAGLPSSYEGITRALAAPGNINDFLVLLGSNTDEPNNNPGLYRTINGGISFTPVSDIPAGVNTGSRYHHEPSWLETDGVNLDTRYLSLRSSADATARGFWRSTDGGSTWAKTATQPFGSDWIQCMAVDHATARRVWVAGGYLGVKRSNDGGDTWVSVPGFNDAMRIDAANGRVAVWGKRSGDTWFKIYYSEDNGVTWTEKTGPGQRYANLSALAVDPNRPGQIWVSGISANVINPPASVPFIIVAGQSPSGQVGQAFTYTLQASGSTTAWTLVSGSLPPGVTFNTASGVLSGSPTSAGSYSATFTATNGGATTPPVTVSVVIQPALTSFIHEPFAYTIGTNNPDPDAGLNSGNGLPAVNIGGNPSGTGTGLRSVWGTTTDVVAGLAYAQGTKTLVTTGGAARVNNATWGGNPPIYRSMTTDPFLAQRIGGTNTGNFGVPGTSLFVSLLGQTSSATADAFRLCFKYDGAANFYLVNTATGWAINNNGAGNVVASGAPLALNTPTLLVLRFDFAAGSTGVSLWVNPPLGQALGAAQATISGITFPGFASVQTRSAVANAMTFDELRFGTAFDLVTPHFSPVPAAPSGLVATANSASQITLTWTDNSADETGFKLDRSPDGLSGWTSVATPVANTTSFIHTGLTAGTAYYYRVRATNSGGDSAWSATTAAATPKLNQTITFGALAAKTYGDASFTLAATASSGLAVSYASSNPAVATVSGNTVTLVGAGSTTITASQSGNTTYNAAPSVAQTLTVNQAAQSISFAALAAKTYGDAPFALGATASSGLVVSYASSDPAVATVSGNTVTIIGAGSTTITASQAGDANYTAATSTTQTLTVGKASQTITFAPLAPKSSDDAAFTLGATASSGLPVAYTSSNPAVATIAGNTVTITGTGSSVITASQPGNANYDAATDVAQTQTVVVGVAIVSESFNYPVGTNNPDPDAGLNSGNGLPATNVGGSPAGTGTGLRTGATGWDITTDVVAGLAYAQGSKTFVTTGGAARVNNATWGGNPYFYRNMGTDPFLAQRIGAAPNGNLGVDGTSLFVSLLGSTSSATVDAFRLSFKYDGTANFYLSNTASGWSINGTAAAGVPLALNTPTLFVLRFDFAAGATDSVRLWVNPPLGQALGTPHATVTGLNFPGLGNVQTRAAVANAMTFDELRLGTSFSAVAPFATLTPPAAPSGLAAVAASSTQIDLTWTDNAANETGFKLERSADGTTGWTEIATPAADATAYADSSLSAGVTRHYRLRATNPAGDSAYTATAQATTSRLSQSITFAALAAMTYGDAPFALTATASSGLAVSYASSNPAVATVSGNTVTVVGVGTATITAMQAGDATYAAATSVAQTLTVNKAAQSITFAALAAKTYGDAPFALTATASSGLAVSYTSSNPAVATVSGNTVTVVGVGTATITASQAGDASYAAAPSVAQTLTVNQAAQSITFAALTAKTYGDAPFALTATASSGLAVSYTSSNSAVATISGNTVTLVGVGSATITATQAGDASYAAATAVAQTLTVNKAGQSITFAALAAKTYGDAPFALTATASSGLAVSYTSSDPAVATVSGNTVTVVGVGSTTITASQPGDATYDAATSVAQTLTVNKAAQSITFAALAAKTYGDAPFALTATASSGLAVSYTSSNSAVATISGNTVTLVGVGTATITATQAGDANHSAAASVDQTLVVNNGATGTIIHESFAYTVGANSPDPDAGLNSGNGLPATNVGGAPAGTSTGLRSVWGTTTDVVAGLAYAEGTKILATSGAAARVNNATWGGNPPIYRSMSADPFLARRVGGLNTGNLGVPGTSLFVSLLGQTSSATADAFRFCFKYDGVANFYLVNTATGWAINNNGAGNTVATGAPLALNTPTFLVLRFDFTAGGTNVSLWVNPPLGQPLGAAQATISGITFPGIASVQTRSAVANAMTFDEFRLGTSYDAVSPFTVLTPPAAPSGLAAVAASSAQIDLTWTDNADNESGFQLERSADGTTGWTQIAAPAAGATSHSDSSLSAGTTYHYRLRAINAAGDSAYTATAQATTSRLSQSITFDPLPAKQAGDAPFALVAYASSGLPVAYASSNSAVATVSGATVTITGVGTATITASQAGDATYLAATSVGQTLTVTAVATNLTGTSAALTATNIGSGSSGSSTVLTTGDWWIDGVGTGLGGTADSARFESRAITGDHQILARFKSVTGSGSAPRAGLMIRESTAAGARYVMLALPATASGSYRYGSRTATGAAANAETTATGTGSAFASPDAWLLLERNGDTIRVATAASDTGAYDILASITLPGLANSVQAGVFSLGGSAGASTRALVSDFEITPIDVDTNLAARWRLDNSLAASPTTYNGTAAGSIAYATGKLGTHALSLPGTNTIYVNTPYVLNPQAGDFTAAAWVKLTTASNAQFILHQIGTPGRAWLYRNSTGKLCTFLGNAETASTTTLATGVWYHVAVVKKGATGANVQLYINGVANGAATSRTVESATGAMRIGAHKSPSTSNKNWNGQIDDVRLYNRALLPSEILTIANWSE